MDNVQLERANADLKQKIKSLQVVVTILLASSGGLSAGLALSLAGVSVQTALAYAATVFFGVIMASIAILTFIRNDPSLSISLAALIIADSGPNWRRALCVSPMATAWRWRACLVA